MIEYHSQPEMTVQIERLARLYLVLSRVNRSIDLADDEVALLRSACQIVVDVGGFTMSWAGLVDELTGEVRPVARAGHDEGYADLVQVSVRGERSKGPTGQALLSGLPVICDDIATDPRMEPWRAEALKRGYRSSIGLPLRNGDVTLGVLTAYSDLAHRFGSGEIELLEELGRDVSRGLVVLSGRAERRRAERALAESEERFKTSLETLIDPFVIFRAVRDRSGRVADFVYEYANAAACAANRVAREDLVGKRLLEVLPEHEATGLLASYVRVIETGEPLILDEVEYEDSWAGERMRRVFDVRASRLGDGLAYTWRDVTERRNAQRRRSEELEQRVRERTAAVELARERAFAVADLTTATTQATSQQEAAAALLRTAAEVGGAADGAVVLVEPPTGRRHVLDSFGLLPDALYALENAAAGSKTPVLESVAAGEPIVLTEPDTFAARYPALASLADTITGRVRVIVPLRAGDVALGAVNLGFDRPRTLDEDELAFLFALSNTTAHALERLRLAEAESEARGLLEAVVSQMPVGVSLVASNGEVMYRNAALDALFGEAAEEGGDEAASPGVQGFHDDGRPYAAEEWPSARSLADGAVVVNEEISVRRPNGRQVVVMQTSAPVRDAHGFPIAAVVVTVDISERKEAEELREAFLGVLSHELRTPVTTIFGGSKLLATRGERLDDDTKAGLTRDIASEAEHLMRLVDDLLVLARAERGVELTSHSAALVQHRLRSVVQALAAEWPQRRFDLRIPDHVPPVSGDEAYLEQVFRNLIGNAAKYGRSDVGVRVTLADQSVRIAILDDGPGIAEADLEHLTELFFRAAATKALPGAGIGLFVARRLVEGMGGRLEVANRPEGGAVFTVTLPEFVEQPGLA